MEEKVPKVKNIEKKIYDVEGFEVKVKRDGKDVRGDMVLLAQYQGERMSKNSFSVKEWKDKFRKQFPGYDVDVLKNNGEKASGQTKLATVRDTYLDSDQ
ncbi:MAG TPA: hypothetical protein H9722_00820 [Candidatus Mediterraneibacter pullistercoris]|nr:hypothetical protein [Candidatus Mediterraneibacter pullistercoris]